MDQLFIGRSSYQAYRRLHTGLLGMTVFVFFACGPSHYEKLILNPMNAETIWKQGTECIKTSDGNLEMLICNKGTTPQLLFELEITNTGDTPQLVDPSQFYYSIPSTEEAPQETPPLPVFCSINPETKIDEVEKKMVNEQASHDLSSALDLACLFGGCLLMGSSMVAGDKDGVDSSMEIIDDTTDRMNRESEDHQRTMGRLAGTKVYWSKKTIRKTTLMKNQTITGKIHFPRSKALDAISFHFPIGDTTLKADYSQIIKHFYE